LEVALVRGSATEDCLGKRQSAADDPFVRMFHFLDCCSSKVYTVAFQKEIENKKTASQQVMSEEKRNNEEDGMNALVENEEDRLSKMHSTSHGGNSKPDLVPGIVTVRHQLNQQHGRHQGAAGISATLASSSLKSQGTVSNQLSGPTQLPNFKDQVHDSSRRDQVQIDEADVENSGQPVEQTTENSQQRNNPLLVEAHVVGSGRDPSVYMADPIIKGSIVVSPRRAIAFLFALLLIIGIAILGACGSGECSSDSPAQVLTTSPASLPTPVPTPTPYCSGGFINGDVCCAGSCGQCGGTGCSKLPGGVEMCCTGSIKGAGRTCQDTSDTACLVP